MPHKNTRKVFEVGGSCAITLPKGWAAYYNLQPKDRLKVVSNGVITIYPPEEKLDPTPEVPA